MKKAVLSVLFILIVLFVFGQAENKSSENQFEKLTFGGYAQIDYNQPINSTRSNGKLDVHRMVFLVGYNFNEKVQFISEIEFEHVKEIYVEQAYLNYKLNDFLNFRAGLMLVPMGLINEFHEPPTFNGVERPFIDKHIAPTTWREIGAGFSGKITDISLSYQAYLLNGFNGYDGAAKFNGSSGLRGGRQKGADSYISSPNISTKVSYQGLPYTNIGVSYYYGDSQSVLYDGLDQNNATAVSSADSSVVGISMLGFDTQVNYKGIALTGQVYYASLSNTAAYNKFSGSDLGSALFGYYAEIAYDVLKSFDGLKSGLIPFVRLEKYNTHFRTDGIAANSDYDRTAILTGLGWKMDQKAMLKADIQFTKKATDADFSKQLNMGIAIMF